MALFDDRSTREADELSGSDVATRALSVAVVENDFVEAVYRKLLEDLEAALKGVGASEETGR